MRLHPYTVPVSALSRGVSVGSTAFFLVAMLSAVDVVAIDLVFVLAPVGFLLGAAHAVAAYLRFEYELTADTLDVASGVFSRRNREIPYGRVQNVDVRRSLVQRLFGVAVLRVETAGGGETEAELSVVAASEATRLQSELRERARRARDGDEGTAPARGGTEPEARSATDSGVRSVTDRGTDSVVESGSDTVTDCGTDPGTGTGDPFGRDAPTPLFTLRSTELAVLALVSIYPGAFVLVSFAAPLVGDQLLAVGGSLLGLLGLPSDAAGLAREPLAALGVSTLLGGAALFATWLASAVLAVTGYYGFRLGRTGDDLVYERGLLQRYSGSIPVSKIQRLTIAESVLARAVGYASLRVETAGYAPGGSGGGGSLSGGGETAVPIARRERVLSLARSVEGFEIGELGFERPPRVARRRYAVRYVLVILGVAAALWVAARFGPYEIAWTAPLWALPLALPAAHLKWRHRGYHLGPEHVVVRSGFWRRRTRIVPHYRIQTVIQQASPFQRRLGLADLTADTASSFSLAGGHATAFDLAAPDAERLRGQLRERLQERLREHRTRRRQGL